MTNDAKDQQALHLMQRDPHYSSWVPNNEHSRDGKNGRCRRNVEISGVGLVFMIDATSMPASNQIRKNRRLILDIENHAIDKRAEIWNQKFDRDDMPDGLSYSGNWEGRKLEVQFQHLESGFLNVSVHQNGVMVTLVVCKACDEHGITIIAALNAEETLKLRVDC